MLLAIVTIASLTTSAQVGEYRNRFSLGGSAGYVLNTMNMQPTVLQNMHGGMTAGLTARYTCEKYFTTLCAVQAEVNLAQTGWKEDIKTIDGYDVVNPLTGKAEEYQRDFTYVQIPIFAHLSWGHEQKGLSFFLNLGPQIGFFISEKTKQNYEKPFIKENFPDDYTSATGRSSKIVAQETMPVENKFDYGIAVGGGVEAHINHIGRISLEGRYYYGLGNIYGDSKRDYFGTSNHNTIYIKLGYLFDLSK